MPECENLVREQSNRPRRGPYTHLEKQGEGFLMFRVLPSASQVIPVPPRTQRPTRKGTNGDAGDPRSRMALFASWRDVLGTGRERDARSRAACASVPRVVYALVDVCEAAGVTTEAMGGRALGGRRAEEAVMVGRFRGE